MGWADPTNKGTIGLTIRVGLGWFICGVSASEVGEREKKNSVGGFCLEVFQEVNPLLRAQTKTGCVILGPFGRDMGHTGVCRFLLPVL